MAARGKLVYVASPYTHPNKVTQEVRFLGAVLATGYLMNKYQDISFYSPISHTHPIATWCKLPGHWQFWRQFDETVLSRCNEIWIVCMDGWQESKGVNGELEIAAELNLPVKYVLPLADGEYEVSETSPAEPKPEPETLKCANHPDVVRHGYCFTCGKGLCLTCEVEQLDLNSSRIYCKQCWDGPVDWNDGLNDK